VNDIVVLGLILLLTSAGYAAGRVHGQFGYKWGYRYGYRQGYFDGDRASWNRRRRDLQAAVAAVLTAGPQAGGFREPEPPDEAEVDGRSDVDGQPGFGDTLGDTPPLVSASPVPAGRVPFTAIGTTYTSAARDDEDEDDLVRPVTAPLPRRSTVGNPTGGR
jgi:hypothetical protein